MAGHGSGGFDGDHGAFNRSHNSGSGAGGVTRDFWGSSGPSPFGSGAGSSSYPNPHLGFDGLDINAGEEWAPEDVEHYAEHLRGSRDLMPPPVRAPSVGGSRRPLFRPPRQAPSTEPSAEDGFGGRLSPDGGSNPRSARTPSRGRGRGHRAHASAGKVHKSKANWTTDNLTKYCECYVLEMQYGNCPGGQMNKFGWKGLSSRYYAATGLLHDREQLQGKLRTLKKLWRFCNLARTHTGVNIDADGFIQATDKWWNDNATETEFMKIRSNGLPPYLDQLDEMFAGNTVDGSSSYVPAAGPTTQVHEVSSDDEGQDDEDTRTPMSLGTKRTGSTSTTATSPNKKTKNTYARVMNQHMNSHLELARERLEVHKNALQKKAQDKEAARTAVNWKIAECSRIAEHELGISRDTPTLLDGLLALAENEAQMDLFLSSSETVRIRIIQKLASNPPPVDP